MKVRFTGLARLAEILQRAEETELRAAFQEEANRIFLEARLQMDRQSLVYALTEHLVHPGK